MGSMKSLSVCTSCIDYADSGSNVGKQVPLTSFSWPIQDTFPLDAKQGSCRTTFANPDIFGSEQQMN